MTNVIERSVATFSIETTAKYCLIKFYSQDYKSDDILKSTLFYTIVKVDVLKAYGGIPKICKLIPTSQNFENSKLFNISEEFKPAIFDGVSYYASDKGKFWTFEEQPCSMEAIIKCVKRLFPKAEYEFRQLLAKNIINQR